MVNSKTSYIFPSEHSCTNPYPFQKQLNYSTDNGTDFLCLTYKRGTTILPTLNLQAFMLRKTKRTKLSVDSFLPLLLSEVFSTKCPCMTCFIVCFPPNPKVLQNKKQFIDYCYWAVPERLVKYSSSAWKQTVFVGDYLMYISRPSLTPHMLLIKINTPYRNTEINSFI